MYSAAHIKDNKLITQYFTQCMNMDGYSQLFAPTFLSQNT